MSYERTIDKIYEGLFTVTVIGLIGAVTAMFAAVVTADGKIDFCYVDAMEGHTGGYQVVGHRSWRFDAHLGVASSAEEANRIMLVHKDCVK